MTEIIIINQKHILTNNTWAEVYANLQKNGNNANFDTTGIDIKAPGSAMKVLNKAKKKQIIQRIFLLSGAAELFVLLFYSINILLHIIVITYYVTILRRTNYPTHPCKNMGTLISSSGTMPVHGYHWIMDIPSSSEVL